jgi:hypothetical protein
MTIFEEKFILRVISKKELLGVSGNIVLRIVSKGEVEISRIFCKVSLGFVQGIARTLISGSDKLCFRQSLRAIFRVHGLHQKHSL